MAPFITIGSARVRKCPKVSKSIMANPLLAAEYDAALNGGIDGNFIYKSCSVLLNWRHTCVDGSENTWAAAPADRSKGRNCRNCYRLNNIQNNFLTLNGERATICCNPEDSIMADDTLAAEYKPELNGGINGNLILKGCGIRVQWQHTCTDGVTHSWPAKPKCRTQGRGCPRCADLRYIFINATTRICKCKDPANSIMANPVLAAQYIPELNNGIDGVRISSQCNAPVIWRHQCSHGCGETHTWSAIVSNRTVYGGGCPYCVKGGTSCTCRCISLGALYPAIVQQIHPTSNGIVDPYQITPHSHRALVFKCGEGHEWTAMVHNRANGSGCPRCKSSNLEKELAEVLTSLSVQFTTQFKFRDSRYWYDTGLPQQRSLIEADGEQHFEPISFGGSQDIEAAFVSQKKRDAAKDRLAFSHGHHLLRIPYTELGKIKGWVEHFLQSLERLPAGETLIMRANGALYQASGYFAKMDV